MTNICSPRYPLLRTSKSRTFASGESFFRNYDNVLFKWTIPQFIPVQSMDVAIKSPEFYSGSKDKFTWQSEISRNEESHYNLLLILKSWPETWDQKQLFVHFQCLSEEDQLVHEESLSKRSDFKWQIHIPEEKVEFCLKNKKLVLRLHIMVWSSLERALWKLDANKAVISQNKSSVCSNASSSSQEVKKEAGLSRKKKISSHSNNNDHIIPPEKNFVCISCGESYEYEFSLRMHDCQKSSGPSSSKSPKCLPKRSQGKEDCLSASLNKKKKMSSDLKDSNPTIPPEKKFVCTTCGKSYEYEFSLRMHNCQESSGPSSSKSPECSSKRENLHIESRSSQKHSVFQHEHSRNRQQKSHPVTQIQSPEKMKAVISQSKKDCPSDDVFSSSSEKLNEGAWNTRRKISSDSSDCSDDISPEKKIVCIPCGKSFKHEFSLRMHNCKKSSGPSTSELSALLSSKQEKLHIRSSASQKKKHSASQHEHLRNDRQKSHPGTQIQRPEKIKAVINESREKLAPSDNLPHLSKSQLQGSDDLSTTLTSHINHNLTASSNKFLSYEDSWDQFETAFSILRSLRTENAASDSDSSCTSERQLQDFGKLSRSVFGPKRNNNSFKKL